MVKVDQGLCIGCGACVAVCPDVFEIKPDGKSHVKDGADCSKCDCDQAAQTCPVGAISTD